MQKAGLKVTRGSHTANKDQEVGLSLQLELVTHLLQHATEIVKENVDSGREARLSLQDCARHGPAQHPLMKIISPGHVLSHQPLRMDKNKQISQLLTKMTMNQKKARKMRIKKIMIPKLKRIQQRTQRRKMK